MPSPSVLPRARFPRSFAPRLSLLLALALLGLSAASAPSLAAATPSSAASIAIPATTPPRDFADQTTLTSGWDFVRGDLGGIWETLRSDSRALQLPVWSQVTLPHSYNATDAVDPDVPYYQGPAWYRTTLDIANPHPGGRTLLHFEGVGQRAQIWIGDQLVDTHEGGYDEFIVDITAAVAAYRASALPDLPAADYRIPAGRIPLAVRADNSRVLEAMPSDLSDFNLYGGIYRPVHLVYLPAAGLARVHAAPTFDATSGQWSLDLRLRFIAADPANASHHLAVRIVAPDGSTAAELQQSLAPSTDLQSLPTIVLPDAHRWSPDSPHLYGVDVTATAPDGSTSHVWTRFGLRTFEFVEKGPFKLNGERLLLRGTHRHEDHAGLAAAMTPDLQEREMRLMKEMGVNFIRLGHYQQSRRILELCDELGLVVWEEIPWCRGGLGAEAYQAQGKAMLRAMIDQHFNHPSVVLWGMGNENDWPGDFAEFDEEKIRTYMRELHNLSHELDPSRVTAIRRCDFCKDIVDVYSPSIWAGWYRGKFVEYQEVSRKEMERVPHFLHVEWGGDSHAGRHAEDPYIPLRDLETAGAADERGLDFMSIGGAARASKDGDWSETYIADLVDWHLKEQENMPWLTGTAMWPFKDFSTPLRPDNPVPFVNQKGAVERDLTPKEIFYVYQSYWSTEPMLRIYGHSWPVRWGKPDATRWLKVYSNCTEVELWLNGTSLGKRTRDAQDFPAAGLRWSAKFLPGMNHVRAVGTAADGTTHTDELTFRNETRAWGAPHHLRLQELPATAPGRARIQVELLDANGVVCLDNRDFVRWNHAGDGRLIADLGLARASRRVQFANGRAEIEIELPPAGRAVVSAAAEIPGVPSSLIHLTGPDHVVSRPLSPAATRELVATIDRERILRLADAALAAAPINFRSVALPDHAITAGAQPGDFLSMGDYWWPNPHTADGLPYVRRDGESNPDAFFAHRLMMRELRNHVASLAAAYDLTGDDRYAAAATAQLHAFFVDPATRMNPHLRFAQAIPGVTPGRGIGIIDTLHLAEVALAARVLPASPALDATRQWFADYLAWMLTSKNGRDEATTLNNHSVAYWLQVAAFATLTGETTALDRARTEFTTVLLPGQLAPDGSFPRELVRTKPYGYAIFQLDNVALLTELLSTPEQNLWEWSLPDGRSVAAAVAFMAPYLADREAWPYPADVAHFTTWPVRQPALLLGGASLGRPDYLKLWRQLDPDPTNLEVRRNMAVTQPLLWLNR
ncbi:alginate lyase family protein [Actomonas aquatica]|uniref:Alginate lyase family protein n=1 Tax=Actomonas aquatica TaxID=2866162 RepID=A0ABZ1C5R4_9BACT|nr:alginate lyase family protein [Opitutus sp. WL0086]WRQ86995.1 alginate lyase family protein [Opitutus sp. WL0086]